MTSSRRFTPQRVPTGGAAATSVFVAHMVEPLRNIEQGRWKGALADWENEGGRVAATDAAEQEPFSIDTETVGWCKSMPRHRHGAEAVVNAPSAAGSVSRDVPGHSSRGRVCPQCNGPVERVRRRILDRLVSWIMPVHRYRCRMKGWGCDWEGNLRTKRHAVQARRLR
jgi:hypothetical protein